MRNSSVIALAAALLTTAMPLAAAPPPDRVLRVAFNTSESGFDPQAVNDNYSYMVCDAIFDSLYTYDYFARPPRLIPNTAAARSRSRCSPESSSPTTPRSRAGGAS